MEKFPLISLTKLTGCRTSTFLYISLSKTCEICGEVIFCPQGHNLNKLGRGSLDDATYKISRLGLVDFMFPYKIIIIIFLINVQVQGHHPHQWAPFPVTG